MKCLNCNTELDSKFCPNCGQKSSTERISFKSFSKSLTKDLIDTEKGILFNLKNLTINPGKSINEYIDGKRKNIFNPISYAVVAITAYLIISKYFGIESRPLNDEDVKIIKEAESFKFGKKAGHFIRNYIKFFFLLHIVYIAAFERLFFAKKNIYELMTMNAFIIGHSVIIGILFYPLFKTPIIFDPFILIFILILSFMVFKKNYSKLESIAIPTMALFFSMICMFAVPLTIFFIINLF